MSAVLDSGWTPAVAIKQAKDIARARIDAVWFAEEKLNLTGEKYYLDIWQKELLQAVCDIWRVKQGLPGLINEHGKNQITIRAMHGPGKTFGVAAVMHWFNFAFRGQIIATAPKQDQLKTRLWPRFRSILGRTSKTYKDHIKVDLLKIEWNGDPDWCAVAETAAQPENLQGYHDEFMLFIVDEASGVNESMFPAIEGSLSSGTLVILILIGNPTKNSGTFYDSHCKPKVAQHYHQVHVDLYKTTRVSHEWVKRMVDKYGASSPVVKVRCYGEFADTDESQLVPLAWLVDAFNREELHDGSLPRLRIIVDVADGGEDETTITAARIYETHTHFAKQTRHSFPSAESPILAAEAAIAMYDELGCDPVNGDDIVVDSLGVGAGTAGYIMKTRKAIPVIVYKGGESSDDPKQWRNRRTQSYICFRDDLRDGRVSFGPEFETDWDDFTAQVCSVKTKPGSERLEELMTKDEMKKKGIKSPDMADGCAMRYATQMPTLPVVLKPVSIGDMESARADW